MNKRRNYEPSFRAKVFLETIKGQKTLVELSKVYNVHPNMILKWKKEGLENINKLFLKENNKELNESASLIDELYKSIGKMQIELEFLKKKL